MKKLLASLVAGGLLLGLSTASYALSYTVKIDTPVTNVDTTNGFFRETYTPTADFEYFTPSVISFGNLTTLPLVAPGPGVNGTFTAAGSLDFQFGQGDGGGGFAFGPDVINAAVTLSGSVGYSATNVPFSTAKLIANSLTVASGPNAGAVGVADIDPNNGLQAIRLDLVYGGTPVSLWFDKITSIPAPGAQNLTISGCIQDVPEPGSMALLVGSGVAGSLLLLRRRRA